MGRLGSKEFREMPHVGLGVSLYAFDTSNDGYDRIMGRALPCIELYQCRAIQDWLSDRELADYHV